MPGRALFVPAALGRAPRRAASRRLTLASQGGWCPEVPFAVRELAGGGWQAAACALWRSPSFGHHGSAKCALLFGCVPVWARCFALAERALGFCRWCVLRPAFGKPGAACVVLLSS